MRKRRIPDIRECMTAVTVEYRSRRPEIETEIFCPVWPPSSVRTICPDRLSRTDRTQEYHPRNISHGGRSCSRVCIFGRGTFAISRGVVSSDSGFLPLVYLWCPEKRRLRPQRKCRGAFRVRRRVARAFVRSGFFGRTGTAVSVCRPVVRVTVPPRARYARSHFVRVSANGMAERPGSARACRFLRHRDT